MKIEDIDNKVDGNDDEPDKDGDKVDDMDEEMKGKPIIPTSTLLRTT